jgi:hypothetical protein
MCFYCMIHMEWTSTWDINVFLMQIDYLKISCKEDVHICCTNFAKRMEQILHETTS